MRQKEIIAGNGWIGNRTKSLLPCSGEARIATQKRALMRLILLTALAAAALVNPAFLFAELGGNVSSVEADRAKMEATLQTSSRELYSVHEMHTTKNVVVREFVTPQGKVFGVAWQGAARPDMRQLLGTYFDQYTQAVQSQKAKRVGRGPLLLQQPGLVLQMGGHMRALVGRAYIPAMVPAGVKVEEIR
jgi:Protein of unknown function (DUF2844)